LHGSFWMMLELDDDESGSISWREFAEDAKQLLQMLYTQTASTPSASDWAQLPNAHGRLFWYSKRSGVTQWETPADVKKLEDDLEAAFLSGGADSAALERQGAARHTPDVRDYLTQRFVAADADLSGFLSREEFACMLVDMPELKLSPSEAEELRAKMDTDGDGGVEWHELMEHGPPYMQEMCSKDAGDNGGAAAAWCRLLDEDGMPYWFNKVPPSVATSPPWLPPPRPSCLTRSPPP
jgi:Ca2+-binding EF-hand superfamily protein